MKKLFVTTYNKTTGHLSSKVVEFHTKAGADAFIKLAEERTVSDNYPIGYQVVPMYDEEQGYSF
jgi:hypothetical protein